MTKHVTITITEKQAYDIMKELVFFAEIGYAVNKRSCLAVARKLHYELSQIRNING